MATGQLISSNGVMTRNELALIPTPDPTRTHRPVPHIEIVNAIADSLSYRHIGIVGEEYAVSHDGARLFGVIDLEPEFDGCRFSLGLRNAHDKSMRLGLTVGYRVMVCMNMAFHGDFTPLLAKHSASLDVKDAIALGVDRMQRNFGPMTEQVKAWKSSQIEDDYAKLVIYKAFVEDQLDAPKHLARITHDMYFNPQHEEFNPRTFFSLSNAFTGAMKTLEPVPMHRSTAALAPFLGRMRGN